MLPRLLSKRGSSAQREAALSHTHLLPAVNAVRVSKPTFWLEKKVVSFVWREEG